MAATTHIRKKQKLEQRIHREELKLAHLKTKTNKAQLADTRLKLRLGDLLMTLNWHELDSVKLTDCIEHVRVSMLDASAHEDFKILGENTLHHLELDKEYKPPSPKLSLDQVSQLTLQKTSLGDLLIKHTLHNYPRATVFGALLTFNHQLHSKDTRREKYIIMPMAFTSSKHSQDS